MSKKHQCQDCPESYWNRGMLIAHQEFQHVGKPGTFQHDSAEKIEEAVEECFNAHLDPGDLDEAREIIASKGGETA